MKDSYYCTLLLCLFIVSEFIVLLQSFLVCHFWHYLIFHCVQPPNVDTVHACMLGAAVSLISDDIVLD